MQEKRNMGIEIFRIFSMFLVVTGHICTQGGVLNATEPFNGNYIVAWVVMILTYCAVNCYALISGYVGVEAKFSYHRLLVLWLGVVFYTIIITVVFHLFKPGSVGLMNYIKAITPATSGQYWYFSAYFALFMMMPFLNFLLNQLSTKQLNILVITVVIVFSVLPTVRHTDPFVLADGYSALWLMLLYIIGGFLRKSKILEKYKTTVWICIVGLMFVIAIASKFLIEYMCWKVLGTVAGGGYLVSYISPVILLLAIALLGMFVKINIKFHTVIKVISGSTFFIYIIHEHPLMKHQFISKQFSKYTLYNPIGMIFAIFGTALVIFGVCAVIDQVRATIFKKLNVNMRCEKLVNKLAAILSDYKTKGEIDNNEKNDEF